MENNKVIAIYEENHGLIGIAKNLYSVFTFLFENKWLYLEDVLEENHFFKKKNITSQKEFIEKMIELSINELNKIFESNLYFEKIEIINYK